QAEDGIRDRNVTGVQTCALPIYRSFATSTRFPCAEKEALGRQWRGLEQDHPIQPRQICRARHSDPVARKFCRPFLEETARAALRSEERRVGKECRAQIWRWH